MQKLHHRVVIYVLIAAAVCAVLVQQIHKHYAVMLDEESSRVDTLPVVETANPTSTKPSQTPGSSPAPSIPKTLLLKVPFTSQAPTANWDDPIYGEGCEEASSLMAAQYFQGNQNATLDAQFVLDEIKRLADWEEAHFGYHLDINTVETAQMIEQVYGLKTKILTDFTEDTLKQELSENHLVILPANGQLLGNPNYRNQGPPYHVLLLKGYTSENFVTNDSGTRKGNNYPYSYKTLYNANGDFDHSTHKVNTSKKMVIVVWSEKQALTTISAPQN